MKRLVKRALKAAWRSTESLRRPILSKLERFLRRCLVPTDASQLNETDVLMDHVVRELVRLQCQVEALHDAIVEGLPVPRQLPAIADENEPENQQLRAG
jgi:hypothetical protein